MFACKVYVECNEVLNCMLHTFACKERVEGNEVCVNHAQVCLQGMHRVQ